MKHVFECLVNTSHFKRDLTWVWWLLCTTLGGEWGRGNAKSQRILCRIVSTRIEIPGNPSMWTSISPTRGNTWKEKHFWLWYVCVHRLVRIDPTKSRQGLWCHFWATIVNQLPFQHCQALIISPFKTVQLTTAPVWGKSQVQVCNFSFVIITK